MKHLSREDQKKAIIKFMASSSSLSEWKHNAETIRQLHNGVFPPFWNTLVYEKPKGEEQSVFEKAHSKWKIRISGTSARQS